MKHAIRRFVGDWLVPPAVAHLLQHLTVYPRERPVPGEAALLARNAKFRNMYAGKRCFIIGNGPSLGKQDLAPLGNEITIVMNRFNRHPIIDKWQPTIFCMAEPAANLKDIGLASYVERVDASAYFFRSEVKTILDRERLVDPEKVYYLDMTSGALHEGPPPRGALDLAKPVPGVWNTSLMAIMLALYMGCSPIYLMGLDHDWLAKQSIYSHFYADPKGQRPAAEDAYLSQYRFLLEMALKVWKSHEYLRDIAVERDLRIFNATAGGYLDVYPRVEYESLFPGGSA